MDARKRAALVTGADRGLGLSISRGLLNMGWTVYAGKYIDEYQLLEGLKEKHDELHIVPLDMSSKGDIQAVAQRVAETTGYLDMIVSNAALMGMTGKDVPASKTPTPQQQSIDQKADLDHVWRSFKVNALGPLELTSALLPLLEKGSMKRLCYVSSEVSSISMMNRDRAFSYPMSKSALNMAVRMIHNDLFPKGYTVRLYHPGWMKRVMLDGDRVEGAMIDPDDSARAALKFMIEPLMDEHRLVMVDLWGNEWPC